MPFVKVPQGLEWLKESPLPIKWERTFVYNGDRVIRVGCSPASDRASK